MINVKANQQHERVDQQGDAARHNAVHDKIMTAFFFGKYPMLKQKWKNQKNYASNHDVQVFGHGQNVTYKNYDIADAGNDLVFVNQKEKSQKDDAQNRSAWRPADPVQLVLINYLF